MAALDPESPRNELEQALAEIWQAVLGVDGVGVHEDFFDLGGHSLLAVTLASDIADLMQVEFRPRDVQHYSTIASQAEAIARALAEPGVGLP